MPRYYLDVESKDQNNQNKTDADTEPTGGCLRDRVGDWRHRGRGWEHTPPAVKSDCHRKWRTPWRLQSLILEQPHWWPLCNKCKSRATISTPELIRYCKELCCNQTLTWCRPINAQCHLHKSEKRTFPPKLIKQYAVIWKIMKIKKKMIENIKIKMTRS